MAELRIDPARLADWDELWPIWHSIVAAGDTYTYDPATTKDEARRQWLGDPSAEVWLARLDAIAAGLYKIAPNQAGPGRHVVNGSYMVSSTARGSGVGRAMVEHSLARAAELGYRGMQFNAVAVTNVHAVGLYERLGFRTIGVVPDGFRHPEQGFVDLLIMYRAL
jgi:L-amino acid N-acyltransferase YncA